MFRVTQGNRIGSCGVSTLFPADQRNQADTLYRALVGRAYVKSFGPQRRRAHRLELVLHGKARFNDSWVILEKITQGWGQDKKGGTPGIQTRLLKNRHYRNGKQFRKSQK
jgi:hypothetical protein